MVFWGATLLVIGGLMRANSGAPEKRPARSAAGVVALAILVPLAAQFCL
jgi:hypothetical protein